MTQSADDRFMALALMLGRRGLGRVWPNPSVGCVIVKDGVVLGRGRTADGGRPHAETQALAQAGTAARGATAYVTLEPCAHHGKTPPCAEALIASKISRCVVALQDPDPRVSGAGIAAMKRAGITVDLGTGAGAARDDLSGFLSRIERDRPMVTLKLATTLDGRIATGAGDSKWITGPDARRAVHAMRARHDAVLIGGGTARADDPGLDVRGLGQVPQPVRVVLSRTLDLPLNSKLAQTARQQPLWLCHEDGVDTAQWTAVGAKTFAVAEEQGRLSVTSVLKTLAGEGITRVFCEGGGQLAGDLLAHGLVDQLVTFSGGAIVGQDGLPSIGSTGLARLSDAPRFVARSSQQIGPDIMTCWAPAP